MPFDSMLKQVIAGRHLRTAVFATLLLAACGDTTSPPVKVPVASVAITTPRDELLVGESHDFDAVAYSASGDALPDRAVSWRSEDATVATISASGLLTALRSGVVTIIASSEGRERSVQVRVIAPNAIPVLAALAPQRVAANRTTPLTIQVQGTGFTAQSEARWNGAARGTEFVSATELRMTLTPDDLAVSGDAAISVYTPAPGGGTSTALPFTVDFPAPTITDITPRRVVMGWGMPLTVTITGTGITGATLLIVNDAVRAIDQRTGTTVTFRLLPADLTVARDIAISLVNGTPGGGRADATFEVESVPVASVQLQFANDARWTWSGLRLPLTAVTRTATNAELTDRLVQWTVTPAAVATINPVATREAALFGASPGLATLRGTSEGVSAEASVRVLEKPAYDVIYGGGVGIDRHIALWPIGTGNGPARIQLGMMATQPSPAPDGRSFAFVGFSEAFPTPEIYIARLDGTQIRPLTTDNAVDILPAWSPDGARLAWVSTRAGLVNVFTMRIDGTDVQQLTFARLENPLPGSGQGASQPAWSPDGQQIAYTVGFNGASQLWVMNADGSNKRRLTDPVLSGDFEPTWSADGRHIVVRRGPSLTGSRLVRIDVITGQELAANWPQFSQAWTPSFSPDGDWLMMTESTVLASPRLFAVPARLLQLGDRPVLPALSAGGIRDPRWILRTPSAGR